MAPDAPPHTASPMPEATGGAACTPMGQDFLTCFFIYSASHQHPLSTYDVSGCPRC